MGDLGLFGLRSFFFEIVFPVMYFAIVKPICQSKACTGHHDFLFFEGASETT